MKKPQLLSLSIASVVLLASLGALRLIDNQVVPDNLEPSPESVDDEAEVSTLDSSSPASSSPIDQRLSFGNRILIPNEDVDKPNEDFQAAKLRGVEAMEREDYEAATLAFEEAIEIYPNAPETLIYLNNARIGNKESYTIAISVPINENEEKGADVAKEMLRGIAHKQDEVNSLGNAINGLSLRVLIADDDGNEETAKQVAKALANEESVLGVVGHFTSDASLAASDIYQEQNLVMISPTSTSPLLSTKGDYIFRSVTSDIFNASALVNYMLNDLGYRNAAIFYNSGSDYSNALKNAFKERLLIQNGKTIDEFDLFKDEFNASEAVQEAIDKGAEVLVLFHNTGVLSKGLEVIEANDGALPILSGDSGYRAEMLELHEYTENILKVTVPWNLVGNEDSLFSRTARQLWGANVSWRTAMTYDATQALTKALEQANSREEVQAVLSSPDFTAEGVAQTIEFQENTGDRDSAPQLVTVGQDFQNPDRYVFVPAKTFD